VKIYFQVAKAPKRTQLLEKIFTLHNFLLSNAKATIVNAKGTNEIHRTLFHLYPKKIIVVIEHY